jgi:hypothetical protein
MQRTLLNLVVDLTTAFALLAMALTGYILEFPLPPGTNKDWMLWGLTRHQWGEYHFWNSLVLLVLIGVHVCLHWNWIVTVIRQRLWLPKASHKGIFPDAVLAVATLAILFGGFAWIAHFGVERVPDSHNGTCHEHAVEPPKVNAQSSPVETPSKEEANLTWMDVYPILENACLGCHGPQKQHAGFRVDQVEKLLTRDGKTGWILPGRSAESPLIEIVSGKREIAMPSRHRLPDADVVRLRKWIDAGAALTASSKGTPQRDAPR